MRELKLHIEESLKVSEPFEKKVFFLSISYVDCVYLNWPFQFRAYVVNIVDEWMVNFAFVN